GKPAAEKPSSSTPPLMWIGAAMVMGFGLRFVHIPTQLVPLVIGTAVTAATLLVLRLVLTATGEPAAPIAPSAAAGAKRANEAKKANRPESRAETRQEVNA